jgi:hypothetical protein
MIVEIKYETGHLGRKYWRIYVDGKIHSSWLNKADAEEAMDRLDQTAWDKGVPISVVGPSDF